MHVAPAPIDLAQRAAVRSAASLDLAAVRKRVEEIAPGARTTDRLDRLGLYVAMLEYDPKIAQARAAVAVAAREAAAARKAASPSLTLTSEYANDPSADSPWALGGALNLPLDFGDRRSARIDRANLAVVAARYDLAETIWAERTALQRGLVDYFAGSAQVERQGRILALRDAQLAVLEARARSGEIAGLDLYPYRQQRAAAARARDDAQARSIGGLAAAAGVLGVPAAALAGEAAPQWSDFDRPTAPPRLTAEARRAAMAGRADVLRALVTYDQAEADLRGELAKQAPAISLGPGYTWERGLVKLPFALSLSLPSFDLNRSAIRGAEARRAAAGATIETAVATVQTAIESAEAEQRGAAAALERLRMAELPQTELAARRADDRLQLGAIGRAEWQAAQIAALEAGLAEIDAVARARLAEIALEDALRRPIGGPETQIVNAARGDRQ
ncbi:TolC family protein [Novosphingobium flavum]|uniref:TolC family protein n=2 Tax=Novosphingobium flavum TaxID=1778672 RepID=A0A7X1FQX5_9SPHN|nr:TolC family protein [Novosphingobium flavum]MBC2665335.1 TolC family protein [Novosphingobium flavum]